MNIPEWLKDKRIAVFDLETDYIPTTQIFCNAVVVMVNGEIVEKTKLFTQYWTTYSEGSLMESAQMINTCDYMCAHNLEGFDFGEMEKYLGLKLTPKHLDTLILSKIIFSKDDLFAMDPQLGVDKDLWGSYSLKAFGQRFGDHKIDYEDFSHLNEEMGIYCKQDTELAARLLTFLMEKENFPLEKVVDIEHEAAGIIYEQAIMGFYIDIDKAKELNTKLLKEKGEISRELLKIFSPKFLKDGKEKEYKGITKTRMFVPDKIWIKPW